MPGLDDGMSYVRAEHWKPGKGVVMFKELQCDVGYAHVFTKGYYNIDDLRRLHVGDDGASGIYVEAGMRAVLWYDPNYQGKKVEIKGPARYCNGFPGGFG